MGSVYSPVFSKATGWIVGGIVDHVAKPLDQQQVEHVCAILNAKPVDRPADALRWDDWRYRVLDSLRACVQEIRGVREFEVESRMAGRLHHVVGVALEVLAEFPVADQAEGGGDAV